MRWSQSPSKKYDFISLCTTGFTVTDGTALGDLDYVPPGSFTFNLNTPATPGDPEIQTPVGLQIGTLTVAGAQLPKEFTVTLSDISEDVTVLVIHSTGTESKSPIT